MAHSFFVPCAEFGVLSFLGQFVEWRETAFAINQWCKGQMIVLSSFGRGESRVYINKYGCTYKWVLEASTSDGIEGVWLG